MLERLLGDSRVLPERRTVCLWIEIISDRQPVALACVIVSEEIVVVVVSDESMRS